MKERWMEHAKKADFEAWGKALDVSPLTARVIRNRGILSIEEAREYLYGTPEELKSPEHFREFRHAADLLEKAVREKETVAIATDFDTDGIFAGEILKTGLQTVGASAFIFTPSRVKEGYGLNRRIVDDAVEKGCDLLITCDNGISASEEVAYAKSRGLTVIVTDHHEVPFEERDGQRSYLYPPADAVVDPKGPESDYPFRFLCGAGVAFRLVELLYERFGVPAEKSRELYEYVAIATVADLVELTGENRTLVKAGLDALHKTEKTPLLALFRALEIEREDINAHQISFIIAPCFNAIGRLSDVRAAFELLEEEDPEKAYRLATQIRGLNEIRKEMTEDGFREALTVIEKDQLLSDRVLVVPLSGVHESVIGIVAGRIKENYYRPSFVLTESDEPGYLKGSGRSVPGYRMSDELMGVKPLLVRAGGHAMAAGLTIETKNVEAFRKALNERCALTESDLTPTVWIDARMPVSALSESLVNELALLEPFGTANDRPLFARTDFQIESLRVLGRNANVLKMQVFDGTGRTDALWFGDPESVYRKIREGYGEEALRALVFGERTDVTLGFTFYPTVNEFRGRKSVEIVCRNCCNFTKKTI